MEANSRIKQKVETDNFFKTPVKAIRVFCLDCCCGSRTDVRMCTRLNCSLYPFRMGRRPSKEERSKLARNLQLAMGIKSEFVRTGSICSEDIDEQN